jgi:hypothetical protein
MKKSVIISIAIAVILIVLFGIFFGKEFLNEKLTEEKSEEIPQQETQQMQKIPAQGLGSLCSTEEECIIFCENNRGTCELYCIRKEDELCRKMFPPEPEKIQKERDDSPPVLQGFGFDIEPWNKETNRAGDLMFTKDILFEDSYVESKWVFVEFGGRGQRKNDPPHSNIEYWFFVPLGTEVIAPIDGIARISYFDHAQDYGINFYPRDGSPWTVSFEHVIDVRIKDGDFVKAGDVVAVAAPRINNKVAMTELAVWAGGQNVVKYCPFDFLDESLKPVYKEKLHQLAKDWEAFLGKNIYNEEQWVSPGCLKDKIIEK